MGKSPIFHKVTPVFVGGTGRSGTTVMGDLLGKHPDVRTSTPIEIKFLSNRSGLLDVVFGRVFGWADATGEDRASAGLAGSDTSH